MAIENRSEAFSLVGERGENLSVLVSEYIEKADGMREVFDRLIELALRVGWSTGEKKHLLPGIWAIRMN